MDVSKAPDRPMIRSVKRQGPWDQGPYFSKRVRISREGEREMRWRNDEVSGAALRLCHSVLSAYYCEPLLQFWLPYSLPHFSSFYPELKQILSISSFSVPPIFTRVCLLLFSYVSTSYIIYDIDSPKNYEVFCIWKYTYT